MARRLPGGIRDPGIPKRRFVASGPGHREHMDRNQWLAAISGVQLATGLAGLAIAARRKLPADPIGVHLNVPRSHIVRNSVVLGTGQSAPILMMAAQARATLRLARGNDAAAGRTLGVLGAAMVAGYLVERGSPIWPGHLDRVATPTYVGGLAAAVAMARLGLRSPESHRSEGRIPGRVGVRATRP